MLRTNLSTRQFYNTRAVRTGLIAVAAIVGLLTLVNVVQILRLTSILSTLGASEASAVSEAARLRREATTIRAQINQDELEVVAAAAREANTLIDKRAFSWTGLLAQFEATLPEDVRIRSVQSRLERGTFVVNVTVEGRRPEDIDAFIEALEQTGHFNNVLPTVQVSTEDGLIESTIEGVYAAGSRPGEATP